jgi:hypothetical protein
MLVMSRIRHAVSLNRSEPAKKSGQNIPKNRCRTTVAEPMVETRAELPFIGDQVGLLKKATCCPPHVCHARASMTRFQINRDRDRLS